ncbi:hypothetical protein EP073_05295 [Geovibrio thiophilus]|uniref:DUF4136 domain-containing protein n=1 Tax=Geovibrio thiophilus TaxID=139438 RepID=A0A410JXC0_9BACT|nr:hypothetical protein [Geovibrio thiophilus]QAR32837.1 hypothetical protein EP073_05295 [Geovibrio thiophilus]
MRRLLLISIIILGLFGCASYTVNVTGYGGLDDYTAKTYDFMLSQDIKTDLEAMGYVSMLEKQLACIGWEKDTKSSEYVIAPSFGITGSKDNEPKARFGVGVGAGTFGSGLSLGTFLGTSTGSSSRDDFTKYLDVKLFAKGKTGEQPIWQGKIFIQDSEDKLSEVMPVLVKFAVENFGKSTDGSKEFTFNATGKNMEALETCPAE